MKLFLYEMKKLLWGQKGIILIVLFLIVKIVVSFNQTIPDNHLSPTQEGILKQYLQELSGELTEGKIDYIVGEEQAILQASKLLTEAQTDYSEGKISVEEFYNLLDEHSAITERESAFNVLKNKYLYASGDAENRYLVYSQGWNGLICARDVDFVMLLLLVVLIVPVFAKEYEGKTFQLIFPTKRGRVSLASAKILSVFFIVLIIGILFFAAESLSFSIRYGLPDGNFPIQSLPYFSASPYNLTLFGAFAVMSAIRLLGYFVFAGIIILLSVAFKKYLPSMFVSAAIVLIPYILFKDATNVYRLPFLTGLFAAKGYLLGEGSVSAFNNEDVWAQYTVDVVSRSELLMFIIGFLIFALLLIMATILIYSMAGRRVFARRGK